MVDCTCKSVDKTGINLTCVLKWGVFVWIAFTDLVYADRDRVMAAELLRSYEYFLSFWLIYRQ